MPIGGVIGSIAASAIFGRAKNFIKSIPREVWIGLAVVIFLVAAVLWHNSHAASQLKLAYEQGFSDRDKQLDEALNAMEKEATAWKKKYETASIALSTTQRKLHDETLRSNAARADALRVRGPGAAQACRGSNYSTGLPATSSVGGAAGGQTDADGSGVLADDRAAVPWSWLVSRAESCDADRDEVLQWRNWYPAQKNLYEDSRRALKENSDAR